MKKKIGIVLALILCISLLAVTAAAETVSDIITGLEGPESVYSGDRHEVTFYADGEILALDGKLEFDETQLTLVEFVPLAGDTWTVVYNESTGRFFATDASGFNHPLTGKQPVFKAVFEVAELEAGTSICISCTDVRVATATEEVIASDNIYTATVLSGRPASSDCTLAGLTVEGGSLSPAFDQDVTDYVVYLPHETAKANIEALVNDKHAQVSVEGADALAAGVYNTVTVTCTAEDGTAKVYTLKIWRAPSGLIHTHSYIQSVLAPTCTEAGYTTHTCDCGYSYLSTVTNPVGHSYSQWTTSKEATEDAEGEQTRSCACGAKETRSVAKLAKQTKTDTGKIILTIFLVILGLAVGCGIIAAILFYINIRRTGKFLQKKKENK